MHLLFGFSGRIGRGQWWMAQLAVLFVLFVFVFSIVALSPEGGFGADKGEGIPFSLIVAGLACLALITWISIASTVKRFHDRNKSGFWFLITFVPYIGGIWQFVECGCLAGTPGSNDYGGPGGNSRAPALDDLDISAVSASSMIHKEWGPARPSGAVPVVAPPRHPAAGASFGRRTV